MISTWSLFFLFSTFVPDSLVLQRVQLTGSYVLALQSLEDSLSRRVQGHRLSNALIDSIFQDLRQYFAERGYHFARFRVVRFDGPPSRLIMITEVRPGPLVLIQRLQFRGLHTTRPNIFQKRLAFWIGKPFLPKQFRTALQKVLQQFPFVEFREWTFDSSGNLILSFHEGSANFLQLGLAVDPTNSLVGFAELQAINLFGTGRRLHVSWHRLSLNEQTWRFRYREPWLFGSRFFGEVLASMEFQEGQFFRREYGVDLGWVGPFVDLRWGVRWALRNDYVQQTSVREGLSTVTFQVHESHGWTGALGLTVSKTFRELTGTVEFIPSIPWMNETDRFMGILFAQGHQVRRDQGVSRADLFRAGGIEGPIGVPEGSLLLKDLWIVGMKFKTVLGRSKPWIQFEWSRYRGLGAWSVLRAWGVGWELAWENPRVFILYAVPWGVPWLEGWLSLRIGTRF